MQVGETQVNVKINTPISNIEDLSIVALDLEKDPKTGIVNCVQVGFHD